MKKQPGLIVIEGLDGSGKATQAALLAEALQKKGQAVRKISFPDYQSESSALVRLYLSGALGAAGDVNAYAASVFYAADRYISYETQWKNDYLAGHTIIADRYATSNAAHQMSKLPRGEWDGYLRWLYDLEFGRMRLPRPELVIYLDLPPEVSRRLLEIRYAGDVSKQDIHERDLRYLEQCRAAALYAADKLDWRVLTCAEDGEVLPVERVAAMLQALV